MGLIIVLGGFEMRRLIILFAMLLVPLAVVGASPTQASPTPSTPASGSFTDSRAQAVRITLKGPEYVRKNDWAKLTGRVRGVRGKVRITIMQRNVGAKRWGVEARKRTSRKGRFTHRDDVKSGSRHYKACFKGRCSRKILVQMGKAPTPPSQPTSLAITSFNVPSVEAGAAFLVGGSASGLDGYTVQVQAYHADSSSWGNIGSTTVAGGQWTASVSVTTAGKAVPIRASFSGAIGRSPSSSTSVPIDVYGWYYIYDEGHPYAVNDTDISYGSARVNGVTYTKSLIGYLGSDDIGDYDLSRSCTRFAATLGLRDDAPIDGRVSMQVMADSVTKWSRTNIALGQSYPVDLDITNALRLRVAAQRTTGSRTLYPVFGDARVLCAF